MVKKVIGTVFCQDEDLDKIRAAVLSFLRLLQGLMKDKIGFMIDVQDKEAKTVMGTDNGLVVVSDG